jgi:hypothetical protein
MHHDSLHSTTILDPAGPLMLEFLIWLARRPRTYEETMEAWRTGCPRFPVWEDAHSGGLVRIEKSIGQNAGKCVVLTEVGQALIDLDAKKS